jgi:hypothetical protein
MSVIGRAFEPTGVTQNEAVTASAEVITLTGRLSDRDGVVRIANIGTQTIYIRLDGTAPTTSTGFPMLANTVECFSMPAGSTTVRHIAGSTGSSIYVTPGRGV